MGYKSYVSKIRLLSSYGNRQALLLDLFVSLDLGATVRTPILLLILCILSDDTISRWIPEPENPFFDGVWNGKEPIWICLNQETKLLRGEDH